MGKGEGPGVQQGPWGIPSCAAVKVIAENRMAQVGQVADIRGVFIGFQKHLYESRTVA